MVIEIIALLVAVVLFWYLLTGRAWKAIERAGLEHIRNPQPKMSIFPLRHRFPLKFAVIILSLWLVFTISIYMLPSFKQELFTMMLYLFRADYIHHVENLQAATNDRIERGIYFTQAMNVAESDYWRYSIYIGLVLFVVLGANWVIHRFDTDPFGWRKHDTS